MCLRLHEYKGNDRPLSASLAGASNPHASGTSASQSSVWTVTPWSAFGRGAEEKVQGRDDFFFLFAKQSLQVNKALRLLPMAATCYEAGHKLEEDRTARKQQQRVRRNTPVTASNTSTTITTATFTCPIHNRTCGWRIGLFSHQRTHHSGP